MAKANPAAELKNLISQIMKERQEHQAAIEQIDSTFESLGLSVGVIIGAPVRRGRKPGRPTGKRGPGRPKGSKNKPMTNAQATVPASRRGRPPKAAKAAAKKKGKRRAFNVPGPQSVLDFVKTGGSKGRTTAEIDKNWQAQGRSGHAYITLGLLVRERKLNKKPVKDGKGSVYTVA
jgi:hypothetical protein